MKKVLKKITASLMSGMMLFGSTYAVAGSANAASNEVQPRGMWAVYGDVNNDGMIDSSDAIAILRAIKKFEDLTGSSKLPLEYAVARPTVYFDESNYIPQAADVDVDGYITNDDVRLISQYYSGASAGIRCGQPFYIN